MNKIKTVEKLDNNKPKDYILELHNITKKFLGGRIVANDNITIKFERNHIHALVGENGSGKSTLMNILFGFYKQDYGSIIFEKEKLNTFISGESKKAGIGMVHQHFNLVDTFTVLENILIGQEKIDLDPIYKEKVIRDLSILKFDIELLKKKLSEEKLKKIHLLRGKISKLNLKIEKITNSISRINFYIKRDLPSDKLKKFKGKKEKLNENLKELEFSINEANNVLLKENNSIITKKYINLIEEYDRVVSKLDSEKISRHGVISKTYALNRFNEITKKYNIKLNPNARAKYLSIGEKQIVEILKALWLTKKIIIFDEPTATLSIKEIEIFMKVIDSLKKEGITIIFISHKLKEILAVADRISVIRKGKLVTTVENSKSLKVSDISKIMINTNKLAIDYPTRKLVDNPILTVDKLTYITSSGFKSLSNVSFKLNEGEIFGIGGIEGNGQEELIKSVAGLFKPSSGKIAFKDTVFFDSETKTNLPISERRKLYSHVPIERFEYGIIKDRSINFNSILTTYDSKKNTMFKFNIGKNKKNNTELFEKILRKELEISALQKSNKEMNSKLNRLKTLYKHLDVLKKQVKKDGVKNLDIKKSNIKEVMKQINEVENIAPFNKLIKSNNKKIDSIYRSLEILYTKDTSKQFLLKFKSPLKDNVREIIDKLNVEGAEDLTSNISNLSGGNQQKFLVGRELLKYHELLILGHPTRGLDIKAIDRIYSLVIKNAVKKATLLYSLELSELMAVCDRIAIFYKGKIVDIVDPKKTTYKKLSLMMVGEKE